MPSINRRAFVAGLAAGPVVLRPEIGAAHTTVHGFIGESGKRGAWPLIVGLLATSRPDAHALHIELLRRLHGYPRTLRYMSTDRNKAPFALALIDYYAAADDLTFTGLVVNDRNQSWRAIGAGKDTAYTSIYRRLIETAEAGDMVIRLKERHANRRDTVLRAFLTSEMNLQTRSVGRSGLAELAGFLAGCVRAAVTGVSNGMKRSLAERAIERIGETPRFSTRTIDL